MARENRIKKKIYLENLEEAVDKYKDKNKKLSSILDNQSMLIADLRKEVKYLKNVLANSTDIGRLLKCINQNTGLQTINSVSSNTNDKTNDTHPWAELKKFDLNGELSTGDLLCNFENDLFSDVYPSSLMTNDALPQLEETPRTTDAYNLDSREDVGVCLHIAKHKVSLEFCSACSENALTAWNKK